MLVAITIDSTVVATFIINGHPQLGPTIVATTVHITVVIIFATNVQHHQV